MLTVRVHPGSPVGVVTVPPSKSVAHRALLIASLAEGNSEVWPLPLCDDIEATLMVCRGLGADIRLSGDKALIRPRSLPPLREISCGESGSSLRLGIPPLMLGEETYTLKGRGRLLERPLETYEDLCTREHLLFRKETGRLTIRGPLRAGEHFLGEMRSSQFLSGMMIALSSLGDISSLHYSPPPSGPYASLTRDVMEAFGNKAEIGGDVMTLGGGYRGRSFHIEGDWSHGAVWVCLGASLGDIDVRGLNILSGQGDRSVTDFISPSEMTAHGITFRKGSLPPFDLRCEGTPDLAPPLAASAPFRDGVSVISDIGRLRDKESDRAAGIVEVLSALGCRAEIKGDAMAIYPGAPKGGTVRCRDHRLAMMAASLACGAEEPVTIIGAECLNKSYPRFLSDLRNLGIEVEIL